MCGIRRGVINCIWKVARFGKGKWTEKQWSKENNCTLTEILDRLQVVTGANALRFKNLIDQHFDLQLLSQVQRISFH